MTICPSSHLPTRCKAWYKGSRRGSPFHGRRHISASWLSLLPGSSLPLGATTFCIPGSDPSAVITWCVRTCIWTCAAPHACTHVSAHVCIYVSAHLFSNASRCRTYQVPSVIVGHRVLGIVLRMPVPSDDAVNE